MKYVSTRGNAEPASFSRVLVEGLASDGGLYVPEEYPSIAADIKRLRYMSYQELATYIFGLYIDDVRPELVSAIVRRTYTQAVFENPNITPLRWLEPGKLALLELSHGPTLAFKCVPLQFVGNLTEAVLASRGERLRIVGATSGDTGSAAAYAVKGKKHQQLFMLSPEVGMSEFQKRQMYTLNERNIHNIQVAGNFDDCQDMVKAVSMDLEFKHQFNLGAMNSINWARIMAQVVYVLWAYLRATDAGGKEVDIAVPSGNFGNALAVHIARQMGVPVHTIIVCTNRNEVLNEFFRTGIYRVRGKDEFFVTSSPSMDILKASNLERLIYDLVGRNAALVRQLWDNMATTGRFSLAGSGYVDAQGHIAGFASGMASEKEVLWTIHQAWWRYRRLIDPHTAVGMKVGLEHQEEAVPLIVMETAQPAKFAETIHQAVGFYPPVSGLYRNLKELPLHYTRMDPDTNALRDFIRTHAQ